MNIRAASLAALALVTPCLAADPGPALHYSPAENLEHVDAALIDSARHSIDMAAYVMTDWPVMAALIRAAQRGVKVRIYLDGKRIGERRPAPLFRQLLSCPGIEVRMKRPKAPSMHLKSYLIDGRLLRTGAANFSASGLKRQDNDLLVIESQEAAAAFKKRFNAIFATGETVPRPLPEGAP